MDEVEIALGRVREIAMRVLVGLPCPPIGRDEAAAMQRLVHEVTLERRRHRVVMGMIRYALDYKSELYGGYRLVRYRGVWLVAENNGIAGIFPSRYWATRWIDERERPDPTRSFEAEDGV